MTVDYKKYFIPFLIQPFGRFIKTIDTLPIPPIISSGLPNYEARKLFKNIGKETWLSHNKKNTLLMETFHEYMNADESMDLEKIESRKTATKLTTSGPTALQKASSFQEPKYFDNDMDDYSSSYSSSDLSSDESIEDLDESEKVKKIEDTDFTSSYLDHNHYGLPSQNFSESSQKNTDKKTEKQMEKAYNNDIQSNKRNYLSSNLETDPFEFFSFYENNPRLDSAKAHQQKSKEDLSYLIDESEKILTKKRINLNNDIEELRAKTINNPLLTYWEKWKILNSDEAAIFNTLEKEEKERQTVDTLHQIEEDKKWSSHYEYLAGNQHEKENDLSPLIKAIDIQLNAFSHKDFSSISKLLLVENSQKKSSIEKAFHSLGYIADQAHPYSQTNEDSYQYFAEINADCTTVFKNYLYHDISVGDTTFKAGEFVQEIYRIIIDNISQSMINFRKPQHFSKITENQKNNQKFLTSALFQLYEALNNAEKSTQEPSEYGLTTYPAVFKELVFYVSELFNISDDLKKNTDKALGMVNDELSKVDDVLKIQQSSLIQIHQINNQYVKNFHLLLSYLQNDTHSYNDISLKAEILTTNIPRAKSAMSTQLTSLHSLEFCNLFAPKAYEPKDSHKNTILSTLKNKLEENLHKKESFNDFEHETHYENLMSKSNQRKKKKI